MKALQQILNDLMYCDVATVKRAVLTQIGKTDDYASEYETVYENIPCKLSQYGVKSTAHRDDMAMAIVENLRVNVSPDYDINANDLIDVTHYGQEFKLFVIKAFKYPTHQELDCKRRKFAGSD